MATRARSPRRRVPTGSLCFVCTLIASALAAGLLLQSGALSA